jgi:exopolysaccharide production protein ExoZ
VRSIDTVQWLRGVAALMVVVHHVRNPQAWLFNPLEHYDAFAWGVDIFFVISGFIMFVAARDERPVDFIWRRAVRVVPLYWLATLVWFQMISRRPVLDLSVAELDHLIKSLFFIPCYSVLIPDQIFPYLVPGWTLNYEMFFYFIFFVSLLAKRPLELVTLLIVGMVGLGLFMPTDSGAILTTYTSPMMFEFLAGIWIGRLWLRRKLEWQLVALAPVGLIGLLAQPIFWQGPSQFIGRLIFSSMMLVGALAANAWAPRIKVLKGLGDASYSIYLSHIMVGLPLSRKLLAEIAIGGWAQFLLWVSVSLAVCASTGYLIHVAIERPLLSLFRRRQAKGSIDKIRLQP